MNVHYHGRSLSLSKESSKRRFQIGWMSQKVGILSKDKVISFYRWIKRNLEAGKFILIVGISGQLIFFEYLIICVWIMIIKLNYAWYSFNFWTLIDVIFMLHLCYIFSLYFFDLFFFFIYFFIEFVKVCVNRVNWMETRFIRFIFTNKQII